MKQWGSSYCIGFSGMSNVIYTDTLNSVQILSHCKQKNSEAGSDTLQTTPVVFSEYRRGGWGYSLFY